MCNYKTIIQPLIISLDFVENWFLGKYLTIDFILTLVETKHLLKRGGSFIIFDILFCKIAINLVKCWILYLHVKPEAHTHIKLYFFARSNEH